MALTTNLFKSLKVSLAFILLLLQISCCKKDDSPVIVDNQEDTLKKNNPLTRKEDTLKNYSPTVRFDITGRMLEGKHIDCIDPDYKGNTWVSSGKELYYYKNGIEEKTYTLDFPILDISIAGDETLWIGTNGGGLGQLTAEGITWYTLANASLPGDFIENVEVGLDGRVWFSCSSMVLAGLVVYDGMNFSVFTSDNSILIDDHIYDIGIDHNGSLYIATQHNYNKTNIYRISGNSWECLGKETGTFFWITEFTVGPAGIIYLYELFTPNLITIGYLPILHVFTDNVWKKLSSDFGLSIREIRADRRNYCWLSCIDGPSIGSIYNVLKVYDGSSWQVSPSGLFLNDKITTIKVDNDNKIWIGTDKNGVFILNQ